MNWAEGRRKFRQSLSLGRSRPCFGQLINQAEVGTPFIIT
jgi:hypothetical protein